jgi:hypothetical protein
MEKLTPDDPAGLKASDAGLPAMVSLKGGRSLLLSCLYLFLHTLAGS